MREPLARKARDASSDSHGHTFRAQGYTVYNFEVEAASGKAADGKNTHSYFVGSANGGAWVHNGKYSFPKSEGAFPKEFIEQAGKYGDDGARLLPDGRVRFYGAQKAPRTSGTMTGWRTVREWNPETGLKRTWHETLDGSGNIRIVRPDTPVTGGLKVHYMFDAQGGFGGTF